MYKWILSLFKYIIKVIEKFLIRVIKTQKKVFEEGGRYTDHRTK